jgi:hypothetical protein
MAFGQKPSIDQLYTDTEYYKVAAETEERKKVYKQLKKENGTNWAAKLGIGDPNKSSTENLKSFLHDFKKGSQKNFVVPKPGALPGSALRGKAGLTTSPLSKIQGIPE